MKESNRSRSIIIWLFVALIGASLIAIFLAKNEVDISDLAWQDRGESAPIACTITNHGGKRSELVVIFLAQRISDGRDGTRITNAGQRAFDLSLEPGEKRKIEDVIPLIPVSTLTSGHLIVSYTIKEK